MKEETNKDRNEVVPKDKQTELADLRTDLASDRTDMASERTRLAHERTDLAKQRNHLANERTFQAWIRTSLSLMGFGFIIEQFSIFLRSNTSMIHDIEIRNTSDYSWIIGEMLIVLAIIMLITAYGRYHFIAKRIGYSKHFPSKWLTGLVVICIAIGVALIVFDLTTSF